MGNRYLKTIGTVGTLFIVSLAFAQKIQQPVPNFESPFRSRISKEKNEVIAPMNTGGTKFNQILKPEIEIVNGSFSARLDKSGVTMENVVNELPNWLGLSKDHSFAQVSERTDELGITHTNFQQHFKGYLVEGNLVMLHSKNGKPTSINGNITEFENIEIVQVLDDESAILSAKKYLKVVDLINNYPVEAVIVSIPSANGASVKLARKVRIDSYMPFVMCHVYVDACSEAILKKVNLMAHVDMPGTAQTLYSGSQNIICDSHNGAFRLKESARNIHTLNATNATDLTASGFVGSIDFTSSSTSFQGGPKISSVVVSSLEQSWWYTNFADELPDLYIKIKDNSNQTVYTSNFVINVNPPIVFNNVNVFVDNPPYTIEIWDNDAVGGDDFGGSFVVASTVGTQNWFVNGNTGNYSISTGGNPALDVHWGMEKTFDFYLNEFNRNSFDDNGSIIKQFVNPIILNGGLEGYPNNASAWASPYNFLAYGMGDGINVLPLVGLDIEGHEFTHMVVNNNGNGGLTYQGESGALNESFADIFGTCIEFYSNVNPDWFIGEDVMVGEPFMRSMSNPNSAQQPDTYNSELYWANPNLSFDNGGVHINSGVQNFWFYLLSEGGVGTNDIGNAYNVDGIGMSDAGQIAYRNLINYLTPSATYLDSYYGSLQAAQDLYGSQSAQYTAVQQAWYAVGIGNLSSNFCGGTTYLTAPSGTITDGSGSSNYYDNSNCMWVITPPGATQIQLLFSEFDTEADYDTVFVYDGPDETFPILATWWGNTLPPAITTSPGVGAMCVRFSSDVTQTANGWVANYQAYGISPTCDGGTTLSTPTGSFNDGSLAGNYGNNQECYWFISPPCANSVTLTFSSFNTEADYDGVAIYDGWDNNATQLAYYSGSTIPPAVTSFSGEILVVFTSDFMISNPGFTANYTSTGSAYCSGTTNLNTADYATFSDGSGTNNYCNNQDCKWLIQPPQATSVTLNFTEFDIEQSSVDGNFYDAVEVYDGTSTSAPLLGRFAGNNLPPAITSTGGSMFVRFVSDISENFQGFSAYYTSTQNSYCSGVTTTLTGLSGSFADGSSANSYANNTNCSWLIQPTNVSSITLSFPTFNTELNYDGVIVYDGPNNTSPILGQFSGSSIPASLTSTGGSMYVEFLTDPSIRAQGWSANYTSTLISGIPSELEENNFELYPNPAKSELNIQVNSFSIGSDMYIYDAVGKLVHKQQLLSTQNSFSVSNFAEGNYILRVGEVVKRFVVEK